MKFQVLPSLVGCSDLVINFLIDCPYTCVCVIRTVYKVKVMYTASLIHSLARVIQCLLKFEILFLYQILEIFGLKKFRFLLCRNFKKAYVNNDVTVCLIAQLNRGGHVFSDKILTLKEGSRRDIVIIHTYSN